MSDRISYAVTKAVVATIVIIAGLQCITMENSPAAGAIMVAVGIGICLVGRDKR